MKDVQRRAGEQKPHSEQKDKGTRTKDNRYQIDGGKEERVRAREERSLDSDGDDSSADLLSAELNRISGIAKAKREAEKAELLRREFERIAIVTSRPKSQGKREVVEFRRTQEGEELLRREIERIAGLQRSE